MGVSLSASTSIGYGLGGGNELESLSKENEIEYSFIHPSIHPLSTHQTTHLAAVVLGQQIHLEGDVVDYTDLLLGVDAHLDVVIHGETSASSLEHVESHLVLRSIVEGSERNNPSKSRLPGSKHIIVHLHQNSGILLVDLSGLIHELGVIL